MTEKADFFEEYPEFEYNATSIIKYTEAFNIFTLLLKNNKIIHFTPKDVSNFREWLQKNKIPSI